MSITLGSILTSVYRRMGTKPSDPEFPEAQLITYANIALGELHDDCARLAGGDVLLIVGREIVATADREYALAEQDPAITSVLQLRRVRMGGTNQRLDPVPSESLERASGYAYATTGPDSAIVLRTAPFMPARAALAIDYTGGPPTLVATGETLPTWLPDQFRDVLELMIVDSASAQGGENAISARQLAKLDERRPALWHHWSTRSPGPARRRD